MISKLFSKSLWSLRLQTNPLYSFSTTAPVAGEEEKEPGFLTMVHQYFD